MGIKKSAVKTLFTSLVLLVATGCSYISNFYIFNTSENPVRVSFQIKEALQEGSFSLDTRIVEFDNDQNIKEIKNAYDISFDSLSNTISCKLNKNQALAIGDDINFSLKNKDHQTRLVENLVYLSFSSKEFSIRKSAQEVPLLFQEYDIHTIGIDVDGQFFKPN